MRALIIGPNEQGEINRVVQFAIEHPFSEDDLRGAKIAKGAALLAWKHRLDSYTLELPIGYLVTYTREYQPPGLCDHISISVNATNKVPAPEAIAMICKTFGMHMPIICGWNEEYTTGRVAINIVTLASNGESDEICPPDTVRH